MSLPNFTRNKVPDGIKKIVFALGMAIGAITLLNIVSGSFLASLFALKISIALALITYHHGFALMTLGAVGFLSIVSGPVVAMSFTLFAMKAAIALFAIAYTGLIIKENTHNIVRFAEFVKDTSSTNISNFLRMFTFRIKKETGGPIMSSNEPAAPVEYEYFPYMPSRADMWDGIYQRCPSNPFAGIFSRTTAQAQSLSGMAADKGLETEPGATPSSPNNRLA